MRLSSLKDVPSSIYRLQLNENFTIKNATAILPYLHELGVEGVYCSPIFEATSSHGYDVTDPNKINPTLGTNSDYEELCLLLKKLGMKQILDVIPNHMGIKGKSNLWWIDVLENGFHSPYALFFDIDWNPEKRELKDKILLPILKDPYGKILEKGDLSLVWDEGFWIRHYDYHLPIAISSYPFIIEYGSDQFPQLNYEESADWIACQDIVQKIKIQESLKEQKQKLISLWQRSKYIQNRFETIINLLNGQKGDSSSLDALHELLEQQWYRLSHWIVAGSEINYRRFFNINELVGINIQEEKVFQEHHRFISLLIEGEKVQGLRIDHPDGLYDPTGYFERLRKNFPIILIEIEKILDPEEKLPSNWNVDGTVGYDFLNELNGLFIQKRNEGSFSKIYDKFIGQTEIDFDDLLYERKKWFTLFHLGSDINSLGWRLNRISEGNRYYRDFTRFDLTRVIQEVICCFPVYRTYIRPGEEITKKDENYISIAVERAKSRAPEIDVSVFDYFKDVMLLKVTHSKENMADVEDFIFRFQQVTAPAMAKGLEDSCFYIFNRFISLNEVGGDPKKFGISSSEFHDYNIEKQEKWPLSFLTSSTHDTKRSEDVRMRLNVLSEMPSEWQHNVFLWKKANRKFKKKVGPLFFPDENTEYYIYQTLLGVWPQESSEYSEPSFLERIWGCVLKSIREAGVYTNWRNPNKDFEEATKAFFFSILSPGEENLFYSTFLQFQKEIAYLGSINSLSSLILKMGSPGIADIYQGNELWVYSLMDPDNRRSVDFELRKRVLETSENLDLFFDPFNERLKFFLTMTSLRMRREEKDLFLYGEYVPLIVKGKKREHIVAFLRKYQDKAAIVVAGRFFRALQQEGLDKCWQDTHIILPKGLVENEFQNIFSQKKHSAKKSGKAFCLEVAEIFQEMPFGIFLSE